MKRSLYLCLCVLPLLLSCREQIQYVEVLVEGGCHCADGSQQCTLPDGGARPDQTARPDQWVGVDNNLADTRMVADTDTVRPDTSVGIDRASGIDHGVAGPDAAGCIEDCSGKVCGSNGCGGFCGHCNAGQVCSVDQGQCEDSTEAYEHASESVHYLDKVLDLEGSYGLALAGNHILADTQGGSLLPRETPVSTSGTLDIPEGANVVHAFLWYTGVIFMKPHEPPTYMGDYTPDLGGTLDSEADIQGNGITFEIGGTQYGPYDTSARLPSGQSSVGSATQLSPIMYDPHFGTMTGLKQSVWANRIDITGDLAGRDGSVEITVNPPEILDINGNDGTRNGGNPAGNTVNNLCSGASSWSVVVVYEKAGLPRKNIVLVDGEWARAWDYLFFHSGTWQRPVVKVEHAPVQHGAKFYLFAASGTNAGGQLPNSPTCSCGCGGIYTMANSGMMRNDYFSDTYVDPPECVDDPLHRDRTNGPWFLASGAMSLPIAGNEWVLYQSGRTFTEFPNLFEGDDNPVADSTQPVTDENETNAGLDTYAGHPWGGRGEVTYHGYGNSTSIVEIALDDSAVSPGEIHSYFYIKGDQKDVWKPQQAVSLKYIIFETPLD